MLVSIVRPARREGRLLRCSAMSVHTNWQNLQAKSDGAEHCEVHLESPIPRGCVDERRKSGNARGWSLFPCVSALPVIRGEQITALRQVVLGKRIIKGRPLE